MARMIELNFQPDEKTLRQFGWIAVGGFGFLALLAWQEWLVFSFGLGVARPCVTGVFLVLGLSGGLFSLIAPKANRALYVGLSVLSYPIGFVLSYVILGLLFFGMIAPIGFLLRTLGVGSIRKGFEEEAESYWSDARPMRAKESYFKQY